MNRRCGSWPWLGAAVLAFLATFLAVRQRSTFLTIEARAAGAAALAATHGLAVDDVLALHDGLGADATSARLQAATATFAAERPRCGEPLAALLALGDDGARAAVAAALGAGASADAAWTALRVEPLALPALRFLELRRRFAARVRTRD